MGQSRNAQQIPEDVRRAQEKVVPLVEEPKRTVEHTKPRSTAAKMP